MCVFLAAGQSGAALTAERTGRVAGVRMGRTHLAIAKLERFGWIDGYMEDQGDRGERRRLYLLSGDGGPRIAERLGLVPEP
jgi:DNA-binding PadR family transcriptional regulator